METADKQQLGKKLWGGIHGLKINRELKIEQTGDEALYGPEEDR